MSVIIAADESEQMLYQSIVDETQDHKNTDFEIEDQETIASKFSRTLVLEYRYETFVELFTIELDINSYGNDDQRFIPVKDLLRNHRQFAGQEIIQALLGSTPLLIDGDGVLNVAINWWSGNDDLTVTIIVKSELNVAVIEEEDQEPQSVLSHRHQSLVALRLLEKIRGYLSQTSLVYDQMVPIIIVPPFSSLRKQTAERLEGTNVVSEKESDLCVKLSNYQSLNCPTFQTFISRVEKEPNTLFVMIVDECHYGPTLNGPHNSIVNHEALVGKRNVISLLVSATPYNCITSDSRIPANNVVRWYNSLRESKGSEYLGHEFYLSTIPFKLPFDGKVDIFKEDCKAGTIYLSRQHMFCSFDDVAMFMTSQCSSLRVKFDFDSNSYKLAVSKTGKSNLRLQSAGGSYLLSLLGFSENIIIGNGKTVAVRRPSSQIDAVSPLILQHIRQDTSASNLLVKCEEKLVFKSKKVARDPINQAKPYFTAHVLGADYVFSLVYRTLVFDWRPSGEGFTSDSSFRSCLDRLDGRRNGLYSEVVSLIHRCCRSVSNLHIFDISEIADLIMAELLEFASNESKQLKEESDDDKLFYIYKEKLIFERDQEFTSIEESSWFTETDRIVKMLMDNEDDRPLVMMRVFEKDENRSIETILRHALDVLGLCPTVSIKDKTVAKPIFSIIGDVGGSNLIDNIEDYFLDHCNVSGTRNDQSKAQTLRQRVTPKQKSGDQLTQLAKPKSGAKRVKSKSVVALKIRPAKFEDLLNVPCLLILCDKGRMGDTFPHTTRCFDLRVRTANSCYTTYRQEQGRMCRYPKFGRLVAETTCDPEDRYLINRISSDCNLVGSSLDRSVLVTDLVSKGSDFPRVVGLFEGDQFLAIAESRDQFQKLLEKYRNRRICFREMLHRLPYSLIQNIVFDRVKNAIFIRESTIFSHFNSHVDDAIVDNLRFQMPIIECVNLKSIVDEHIKQRPKNDIKAKFLTIERDLTCKNSTHDFRNNFVAKDSHYDYQKNGIICLNNRFLLHGEEQCGKTEAYLLLLKLLQEISTEHDHYDDELVIIEDDHEIAETASLNMLIPYWKDLSEDTFPRFQFGGCLLGRYAIKILKDRLSSLAKWSNQLQSGNWKHLLEDSLLWKDKVASDQGRAMLKSSIHRKFRGSTFPITNQGRLTEDCSLDDALLILNWDNRFSRVLGNQVSNADDFCIFFKGCTDFDLQSTVFSSVVEPVSEQNQYSCRRISAISVERCLLTSMECSMPIIPQLPCKYLGNYKISFPIDYPADIVGFNARAIIHNWIFTPTFMRYKSTPTLSYLDRSSSFGKLLNGRDYAQALVVRMDQFDIYLQYYGSNYIIIGMPKSCAYKLDKVKTDTLHDDVDGIGYARLFIQHFCFAYGLSAAWILDDNIIFTGELGEDKKYHGIPISRAMIEMERVFESNKHMFPTEVEPPTHLCPNIESLRFHYDGVCQIYDPRSSESLLAEDFMGKPRHYGIIGMNRFSPISKPSKNKFSVSRSVYSFVLVNIDGCTRRGVFYPPKPAVEDIDFANLVDEAGLVVLKLNYLTHRKVVMQNQTSEAVVFKRTSAMFRFEGISAFGEITGDTREMEDIELLIARRELKQEGVRLCFHDGDFKHLDDVKRLLVLHADNWTIIYRSVEGLCFSSCMN